MQISLFADKSEASLHISPITPECTLSVSMGSEIILSLKVSKKPLREKKSQDIF